MRRRVQEARDSDRENEMEGKRREAALCCVCPAQSHCLVTRLALGERPPSSFAHAPTFAGARAADNACQGGASQQWAGPPRRRQLLRRRRSRRPALLSSPLPLSARRAGFSFGFPFVCGAFPSRSRGRRSSNNGSAPVANRLSPGRVCAGAPRVAVVASIRRGPRAQWDGGAPLFRDWLLLRAALRHTARTHRRRRCPGARFGRAPQR